MSISNTQHWNPTQYAAQGRFVSDLGMPVVELLSPQAGEHILDLGCGDGAITSKLVSMGCCVLGVDASAEMIEAARALGVDARVMDGQSLDFRHEFDAVFSNAALHWMPDLQQVVAGVWQALKPGGRFVGEFGAEGNVAAIVSALESELKARGKSVSSPWNFPYPDAFARLLETAGFELHSLERIPRPTLLPGDVGGWLLTFAQPYLVPIAEDEREDFIRTIIEQLQPRLCDADGNWYADYVRLRFSASKPADAGQVS